MVWQGEASKHHAKLAIECFISLKCLAWTNLEKKKLSVIRGLGNWRKINRKWLLVGLGFLLGAIKLTIDDYITVNTWTTEWALNGWAVWWADSISLEPILQKTAVPGVWHVSISRSSERPGEEGQVLRPAQALALSPHYSGLGKKRLLSSTELSGLGRWAQG